MGFIWFYGSFNPSDSDFFPCMNGELISLDLFYAEARCPGPAYPDACMLDGLKWLLFQCTVCQDHDVSTVPLVICPQ